MIDEEKNRHPLDETIEEVNQMEIPPEARQTGRERLAAFRERLDQREHRARERDRSAFRLWRGNRVRSLSAAAALALLAIALWVFLGDRGSTLAFADVLEHFRNAATLTCNTEIEIEGFPGSSGHIMFMEPGLVRQTTHVTLDDSTGASMDMTMIYDYMQGRAIGLTPGEMKAMVVEFDPESNDATQEAGRFIEELRELRDGTEVRLGWREVDGRAAEGFQIFKEGQEWTVWADPESGLPLKIEMLGEMMSTKMRIVMTDLVFDAELDESLFSLELPEGYTYVDASPRTIDVSPATEEDLLAAYRMFADRGAETFPPALDLRSLTEYIERLLKASRLDGAQASSSEEKADEATRSVGLVARMQLFVQMKSASGDWHYAGDGVRIGDGETLVCWWKASATASTYRVLFGDLTVRDVPGSELPEK